MTIEKVRELTLNTTLSLDMILEEYGITHEQYRSVYPDTPVDTWSCS